MPDATDTRRDEVDSRAGRPTRNADRNRTLAGQTEQDAEPELLPALGDGLTLLDVEGDRGVLPLQSLVLDHLLANDGPALWVDASGFATTTSLVRLAPSRRLLDRVHVARGFTAYQHYAAVCALPDAVARASSDGEDQTPALFVVPAVDARYRDSDTVASEHARTLQARTLGRLRACAEACDAPVLVTRTAADEFTAPVAAAADHRVTCRLTRAGPRFVGEDFETLVYPRGDGFQTTLSYWRRVLAARASQVDQQPAAPPTPGADSDGVGTARTVDGEAATLTPNPVLDAWTTGPTTGGR
jgi:hypothetical protein